MAPLLQSPVPLPQSPLFARALLRLGREVVVHPVAGGAGVVVLRRKIAGLGTLGVISRGDLPDGAGLCGLRRALGLSHLIVSPEHAAGGLQLRAAGFVPVARPVRVAMLSLAGGAEQWLPAMGQKWRNRLRHGQRQGLVVERHQGPLSPGHWIFRADAMAQKQRGYRAIPHAVVAQMSRDGSGDGFGAAQLFLARQGREIVGAMVFLRHGAMASYQIGWSDGVGRALSAHNLLMWEAMGALAAMGHEVLDLGILDPKKTPGIDRFKLGSGAQAQLMGGTWMQSAWAGPLHTVLRARATEGW